MPQADITGGTSINKKKRMLTRWAVNPGAQSDNVCRTWWALLGGCALAYARNVDVA